MNFSKFSILASIVLISTFAVAYAISVDKDAKVENADDPAIAKDAGGASTEGASSDFDIQQLLKMIEALKDQDFDGFEDMVKGSNLSDDKKTEPEAKKEASETPKETESEDTKDEEMKDEL